jgi:hypothetical protein
MKSTVIAGLLASFAGIVVACSASSDAEPRQDPPVTVLPDAGDASVAEPDAAPDAPATPKQCSAPLVAPTCTTTKPAPTSAAAITKFVKDSAVPLRCDAGNDASVWDVRPLVDLYGDQKMFMIGEVHGSNEIGIVSSVILEQLAAKDLVNVVGFEMPMDIESSFQHYIDTGKDALTEQYLPALAPNFFAVILTKTARELTKNGHPLRLAAVDVPFRPQSAADEIRAVAAKMATLQDFVLATLPTSNADPPSPGDVEKANAYFDHILANKFSICTELSAADCDRLVAMTHAFWASTARDEADGGDQALWFERREQVIYYNMHAKMAAPTDRMFLHMGAAHTNKYVFSAGSRMATEYALTKGKVFSVAPAYGDGSVIWYGQDVDLPGEPTTVTTALTQAPGHPFFVSTTRPSAACEGNPLGAEDEQTVGGGKRGELYDGYIHYGKLTSERRPKDTILAREGTSGSATNGTESTNAQVRALAAFRARIEKKERSALAAGALTRTSKLRR